MPPRNFLAPELADLADLQDGIVSRQQLRALGIDRNRVSRQVGAGRWRTYGGLAVALHNGPLTQDQRDRAAVIDAGPHAALGGISALRSHGLRGWHRPAVAVVTRKSRNEPPLDFSVVHESRTLADDWIQQRRGLRICLPARAAVDGAGWEPSVRSAIGLLAATAQQSLATPAQLSEALERAGRIRHHRALTYGLRDIEGGADALSEIDAGRICRQYGLPDPVRQAMRTDASGRRRYLDLSFRLPDGGVLAVEIDGAVHLGPESWWSDSSRSNALVITGARLLRFPAWLVRESPEVVAQQLRTALVTFGALAA